MSHIFRQFDIFSCWSIVRAKRLISKVEVDLDGGKESILTFFWFTLKTHLLGFHFWVDSLLHMFT
jgi:hypothetical protein